MIFNRSLVKFESSHPFAVDRVIYDGVDIGLTRENLFEYVTQSSFSPEEVILIHYKKYLSKLRDRQLEDILDDREG